MMLHINVGLLCLDNLTPGKLANIGDVEAKKCQNVWALTRLINIWLKVFAQAQYCALIYTIVVLLLENCYLFWLSTYGLRFH